MGKVISVIKRFSHHTPRKQVLPALVLSYLWLLSSAARKHLVKLQLVQNRVARFALNCNQRADIKTMQSVSLG
jgi:hypothetical protein